MNRVGDEIRKKKEMIAKKMKVGQEIYPKNIIKVGNDMRNK